MLWTSQECIMGNIHGGWNKGRNKGCSVRNSVRQSLLVSNTQHFHRTSLSQQHLTCVSSSMWMAQVPSRQEGGKEEQPIHWICAIYENRDKEEKQSLPPNFALPCFDVLLELWFGNLWPSDTKTWTYVCMSAHVRSWRHSAQLAIARQFGASAEVQRHHHCVLAVSRCGVASRWGRKWEKIMQQVAACSLQHYRYVV